MVCIETDCNGEVRKPYKKKNGRIQRYNRCSLCLSNIERYRLSTPARDKILLQQNNKCKTCGTEIKFGGPQMRDSSANVDHCHTTGKVRGILCNPCNTSLGKVRENITTLTNMIEYLWEHRNEE